MSAEPVTLTWKGADALAPEVRERLMGPGAPFEIVTEEGNSTVTQIEEMLCCLATHLDVVHQNAGHTLDSGANGDDRHPQVLEGHHRLVGKWDIQGEQPIHPLGQRPGVDAADSATTGDTDRIQQQVVALLGQYLLRSLDDGGKEPARYPGCDHPDGVGPARCQCGR